MKSNNDCSYCGYNNRLSASFCAKCGIRIEKSANKEIGLDQEFSDIQDLERSASEDQRERQQQKAEIILSVGKDHIERDKIVKGDIVYGDKVERDKISIRISEEQSYNVSGLPNPYLGLRSFTYADRSAYAGREDDIKQALKILTSPGAEQPLLFVTGTSGSGKSSFAQAGLLPALEAYYEKRHRVVQWAIMRPGTRPQAALTDALAQLCLPRVSRTALANWGSDALGVFLAKKNPDRQVNLLVIDQFEEFFTQSPLEERKLIFDFLVSLPEFTAIRTHIVVTMRSDYLDELFTYKALWEIAKQGIELRAMTAEELKAAILGPLEAKCWQDERCRQKQFEPELLERLAKDAALDAAYLPLLQVTLSQLWLGGSLTLGSYHGLAAAIKERAEVVYAYNDFNAAQPTNPRILEERSAIIALFLDLLSVSLGKDTRREIRRWRLTSDLETDPTRKRVLADLVDARLVSVSLKGEEKVVEIIHESLIANWERLQLAIDETRERLQQRRRFELALDEWLAQGLDDEYLLVGVRLAEASALDASGDIALNSQQAGWYLSRSQALAEAENRRKLEQARALAKEQRKRLEAEQQRTIEQRARFEQAQILVDEQRKRAEAEQRRAEEQHKRAEAEKNRAEEQAAAAKRLRRRAIYLVAAVITALCAATFAAMFGIRADDNARLASTNAAIADKAAEDAQQKALIAQTGELSALGLAKLESELDVGLLLNIEAHKIQGSQQTENALFQAWRYNPSIDRFLQGHDESVISVAWSGDGRLASGSFDGSVIVWDLGKGEAARVLDGHDNSVRSVAWSADGRLASGDANGRLIVWDLESGTVGQTLERHTGSINSLAWSQDGRLASSGNDGRVIVWDLGSSKVAKILEGHQKPVASVAWSTDGRLASGGWDNQVIVWNLERGEAAHILDGHTNWVLSVAWSADGRLASGSFDNRVIVWDLENREAEHILEGHTNWIYSVAWSVDGRLASGALDNRIIVWNLERGIAAQTLEGHTDWVRSVAWSQDGRLASGGNDGRVIVWDLKRDEAAQILEGHFNEVQSVSWSMDGRLASGGRDNKVIVWDPISGKSIEILEGHLGSVYSVAWSDDGRLASGSSDERVIVWNLENGEPSQILNGHTDYVTSVAWSQDGRLASSGIDGRVIVWDIERKEPAQILEDHQARVNSIAWSADGHLASGGDDGRVIVWDLASGQAIQVLNGHSYGVNSVTWSVNGILASAGRDGRVIVWDLANEQAAQILEEHTSWVMSVMWSEDGQLASGGSDGKVILWNLERGIATKILPGHTDWAQSVAWSKDGRLASGGNDGRIVLWNLKSGEADKILTGHAAFVYDVAWSEDGRLASGGDGDRIIVWDLENGKAVIILDNKDWVRGVAWSNNNRLASTSSDGVIVWNLASGDEVMTLEQSSESQNDTGWVWDVAWSEDGRLASGDDDGRVTVWNLDSGHAAQILEMHTDRVNGVSWSRDGLLASGGDDGRVIVWDPVSGQAIYTLIEYGTEINSVAWSPDGRLAYCSSDGRVFVWKPDREQKPQILEGHAGWVWSVAWSVDGRLASGGSDGKVIVWDLESREAIKVFEGHRDEVLNVAWSVDGRLASSSEDGTVRIWQLNPDVWAYEICQRVGRNLTQEEWERYIYWKPFDPEYLICPKLPEDLKVINLINQSKKLAADGNLEGASTLLGEVLEIAPGLRIDPQIKAKEYYANSLVVEGEELARNGEIEGALEKYTLIYDIGAEALVSHRSWNTLCWYGSLWGYAERVLYACDNAITLSQNYGLYYDSRGLSRALSGDLAGAIQDFEFFIEWCKQNDRYDTYGQQREGWLNLLRAGQNPFDAKLLEALKTEG